VAFPLSFLLIPDALSASFLYAGIIWAVTAGIVAFVIDLDIIVMVAVGARKDKRLRPYNSIQKVARDFRGFIDTLYETGLLKKAMLTHLAVSILLIVVTFFVSSFFIVPVVVGVVTHLATDIPHVKRIIAG
jgi:hypothetical protein